MSKKKIDWLYMLFWVFVVIFIIMILTRIFGHSATDLQIFISISGIFFTSIADLYRRIGNIESDIRQIKDIVTKKSNF